MARKPPSPASLSGRGLVVLLIVAAVLLAVAWLFARETNGRPTEARPADASHRSLEVDAEPSTTRIVPSAKPATAPLLKRVLLLTIDTLRADQPWSGYHKAHTPALSRLAQRSLLYLRAYALANTTGPSLAGLLTSRYPGELGRDDCPLAGFDIEQGLAEQLSSSEVWTAAVHGHPYFASSVAPRRGFQVWRTVANVKGRRATDGAVTGDEVTDIAIDVLRSAPVDRPVFLWAHYVDPHDKYVRHPNFPPSQDPARSMYDGEVAFVDHQVGRLLNAIDATAAQASTAVVLTADHGEAFGEHERWRHGTSVYEEEIRVPLMVFAPGVAAKSVSIPRSTIDVAPTITALFGLEPAASWRGRSLLQDAASGLALEERPVIVDCPALMNTPARRAVLLGSHKMSDSDGRITLVDLAMDPRERKPLPRQDTRPILLRAEQELSSIQAIPPRRCARQAFRGPG